MNVLVTGGTGYIGVNLLHEHVDSEHTFRVLTRESSRTELLPDGVETVLGDITDPSTLPDALDGIDGVVHLAAVNPGSTNSPAIRSAVNESISRTVNVEGTRNLLEAAEDADVDSFLYASTTNAHPAVSYDYESFYVDTKREGGDLVTDGDWSFRHSIIHPTYVMGPRDHRLKRYRPFRLAAGNAVLFPPLYVPGSINIVHVDDVAASIVSLLDSPTNGRHILSGPNVNRRAFANVMAQSTRDRSLTVPIPFNKTFLPRAVNLANRLGVVDFTGDRLVLEENTGIVPSKYENQRQVERRTWKDAVVDLADWYSDVGLL